MEGERMKSVLAFATAAVVLLPSGCSDATYPFQQVTSGFDFTYSLPTAGSVEITVQNCYMSVVRILVSSQQQSEGEHSGSWDLMTESGERVSDGLYYIRVELDGDVAETMMYEVYS